MKEKNGLLISALLLTILLLSASNCFSFSIFGNEYIKKAKGFIAADMHDKAADVLKEEINGSDKHEANPTNAEAHFLLGEIYFMQGKILEADERFSSAKKLDSKYGPIIGKRLNSMADGKMTDKKFMQAGILYEKAAYYDSGLKEKISKKQFELGVILANQGNCDNAEINFKNANKSNPRFGPKIPLEYIKAADVQLKRGNIDTALLLYEKALGRDEGLKKEISEKLFNYGKEKNSKYVMGIAARLNPELNARVKEYCWSNIKNLSEQQLLSMVWDANQCGNLSEIQKETIGKKLLAEGDRQNSEGQREIYMKKASEFMGEQAVLEASKKYYTLLLGKPEEKTLSSNEFVEIAKIHSGDIVYFLSLEKIKVKCESAEMTWGEAIAKAGVIRVFDIKDNTPLFVAKNTKSILLKVYYWTKNK